MAKVLKPRNVTKFNVPCAFGGQASEVAIYIGSPESKHNPIHFQAKFIQDTKGGVVPQTVLESLEKLQKLSIENGVPFEELCRYALNSIEDTELSSTQDQSADDSKKINSTANESIDVELSKNDQTIEKS